MIDDDWAKFFKKNNYLVGLSLDGPAQINDLNRVDVSGKGTFNRVIKAADALDRQGAAYNVLSVVTGKNARSAEKIYNFLKKQDSYLYYPFIIEKRMKTSKIIFDFNGIDSFFFFLQFL